jgi:hypothetical protein
VASNVSEAQLGTISFLRRNIEISFESENDPG